MSQWIVKVIFLSSLLEGKEIVESNLIRRRVEVLLDQKLHLSSLESGFRRKGFSHTKKRHIFSIDNG
jgi:hypothetical protein